jgi:hypothetical protein
MSFGIRIWGANGALELDENSFTVRVVYSAVIQSGSPNPPGRSIFIPISGVDPSTHSAVCIPITNYGTNAQDIRNIQYIPIVGNGGVTVFWGQPNTSGPMGVLTPQRLLVMKYR